MEPSGASTNTLQVISSRFSVQLVAVFELSLLLVWMMVKNVQSVDVDPCEAVFDELSDRPCDGV